MRQSHPDLMARSSLTVTGFFYLVEGINLDKNYSSFCLYGGQLSLLERGGAAIPVFETTREARLAPSPRFF